MCRVPRVAHGTNGTPVSVQRTKTRTLVQFVHLRGICTACGYPHTRTIRTPAGSVKIVSHPLWIIEMCCTTGFSLFCKTRLDSAL